MRQKQGSAQGGKSQKTGVRGGRKTIGRGKAIIEARQKEDLDHDQGLGTGQL
jgi:hypothetical protein